MPEQSDCRNQEDLVQWHRLFGMALTDLFSGSPWRVELEKELALHSQLLDVVIIEQAGGSGGAEAAVLPELPDGLEGLRPHNLLTYKSRHEPLDAWALDELIGHYVNYRKLTGREGAGRLPPERDYRLYAVATRHPHKLARSVDLEPAGPPGVFDLRWGGRIIRLIVLGDIAEEPRNAPWELFSVRMERLRHGAQHYRAHHRPNGVLALLYELYLRYQLELSDMAYTLEDFVRENRQHVISGLSLEERLAILKDLPAEERLRGLPAEERLRGLPAEERLRGLSAEELERLAQLFANRSRH